MCTIYYLNRQNKQYANADDINIVMPMYNLIEYSDNHSKESGILRQYCRDETAINAANSDISYFNAANATTSSFKIKEKITGQTDEDSRENVKIMVVLKYLSKFWRTLEMPLINCEINLNLNWSKKRVISAPAVANQGATFSITDTKLYVPVVILSTQDNAKLIEQNQVLKEQLTGINTNQKNQQKDKTNI